VGNTNLVSAIAISGSGSNYSASISLVPFESGTSSIIVNATNAFGVGSGTNLLTVTFVEVPPTLAPIPPTSTPPNTPVAVPLTIFSPVLPVSNLTYSATISDPTIVQAVNFSFNGSNEVATVVPVTNRVGVVAITITVGDGTASVSQAFVVTVVAPTPPTLAPIANQSTVENTPIQVTLNVSSPVTPLANLTFSGSSTNSGTNGNIVKSITFAVVGTNEVATITPATNALGTATVTITVGNSFTNSSQSFSLQVLQPVPPTLTISVVGGTVTITFTGTPGISYNLESSTDLINWATVQTITANASTGAGVYSTTAATTHGGVFYRLEFAP